MSDLTPKRTREAARVIRAEAQALNDMADALESEADHASALSDAVTLILDAGAHLVVAGVGKSGHVGAKIAASFASTGTPAFFLHPTEASHGDLGMLTPGCVVLAISNSGESRELGDLLHYCARAELPVIAITRDPDSALGRAAAVVLRLPRSPEAGMGGLAPTVSTTATLALGDALVVTVMDERGLSADDFGRRHPGGKLGRRLQTVGDWMRQHPNDPPTTRRDARADAIVHAISAGRHGCVAVLDADGAMAGIITDGDLRRAMRPDIFELTAAELMTADPLSFSPTDTMGEVVEQLTARRIANAFVVDERKRPVAVLHINTLMRQGYA